MSDELTTESIRPAALMAEYERLRQQDLEKFLNPKTGSLRQDLAHHRPCPSCGQEGPATHMFEKHGFTFVRCDCGMVFVDPSPVDSALRAWYAESASQRCFSQGMVAGSAALRVDQILHPRLARMTKAWSVKRGASRGRLLEIGSSNGYFLELALADGWSAIGVEPDPKAAEAAAARTRARILTEMFEDVRIRETFDVVVAWELIEHIDDPFAFLSRSRDLLNVGGALMLTTPNVGGIEYRAAGAAHELYDAPEHINYYAPDTMRHLLERVGFSEIDISTPGELDLDNVLRAIGDRPTAPGDRFLVFLSTLGAEYLPVRRAVINALQRSLASGHMQIAAWK